MEGHPGSSRNKKRLMQVHIICVVGTLSGLKQMSDGILFVSEKNHGAVWRMGTEIQDVKAVDWLRDGGGLGRVVDEEVVKSGETGRSGAADRTGG